MLYVVAAAAFIVANWIVVGDISLPEVVLFEMRL